MNLSVGLSLALAVFGFILTIAGVIWFEISKRSSTPVSVWAYILMILGIILLLTGLILVTFFVIRSVRAL